MEEEEQIGTEQGGPQEDFGWMKPIEIDKALLTPQSSTTSFSMTVPVYEKKPVAVLIRNPKDGSVFHTADGQPFYNLQEEVVMLGFETKTVNLPGQEVYNIDLTSSYLSEFDVPALRALISLYGDLQLQVLRGKTRVEDVYYVYNKIMGIVNTAKARDGKTARLSKSTISEGTSKMEQSVIENVKDLEKKRSMWEPMSK